MHPDGKRWRPEKRARAEAPRTGVYVISAWNVRGTGRTGCNRAQGSFFADELNPAKHPLMWKTAQRNIHKHHPLDEITHRSLPLLTDRSAFPLLHPQLVPTLIIPPLIHPLTHIKPSRVNPGLSSFNIGERSPLPPLASLTCSHLHPTPLWVSPSSSSAVFIR